MYCCVTHAQGTPGKLSIEKFEIVESLRLEKTIEIDSSCNPTKWCSEAPHLHASRTLPGMATLLPPWDACFNTSPLSVLLLCRETGHQAARGGQLQCPSKGEEWLYLELWEKAGRCFMTLGSFSSLLSWLDQYFWIPVLYLLKRIYRVWVLQ